MLSLSKAIFSKFRLDYIEKMEAVATFFILLIIYFLGSLAIVQLFIRPMRKPMEVLDGQKSGFETNHTKILLFSILLSLATTTIAYLVFP